MALPEVHETKTFGKPTFQAGRKTFAVLDRYGDEDCLAFKATPGMHRQLVREARFFPSPFGARHGWTCMRIQGRVPWAQVELLVVASYRMLALGRMLKALDLSEALKRPQPRRKRAAKAARPARKAKTNGKARRKD